MIRASEGRTVVFTTHKVSQAQLADRIVVMSRGCVVEQGTHAELMRLKAKLKASYTSSLRPHTLIAATMVA